jgi:hypothetical protein
MAQQTRAAAFVMLCDRIPLLLVKHRQAVVLRMLAQLLQ